MVGLGRHDETEIECPFCGKGKIRMFHQEGYMQARKSSISNKSSFSYHRVGDSYIVQNGCSECGKSVKEVQKALDTGITKKIPHKERLKKMKDQGMPTRIEF